MEQDYLCACGNKLKCEGSCREEHLFRARKFANPNHCPAAYKVRKVRARPTRFEN